MTAGYATVIEGENDSLSAYAPELPGCVAAWKNVAKVKALMPDAIQLHIEVMVEHGGPDPAADDGCDRHR